jgi:hypothetical protein
MSFLFHIKDLSVFLNEKQKKNMNMTTFYEKLFFWSPKEEDVE